MGFSELSAKNKFTKSKYFNSTIPTIGLVSRLYQCQSSLTSPLLAANASQQSKLPISVKPVAQQLFNNCNQKTILSCPSKLNINGSISITDSKNVAIVVSKLLDITVEEGGLQISIPEGGLFTINGKSYTKSPIAGLIIAQNSQPGVRIDCSDTQRETADGVYIGPDITISVQDDITISNNKQVQFGGDCVNNEGSLTTLSDSSTIRITDNVDKSTNAGKIIASGAGSIIISNNIDTDENATSGRAFYNSGTIATTGSGDITISDNQATKKDDIGGIIYGVYSYGTITASGDIIIKNNQAAGGGALNRYGVLITSGSVKTNGDFIITTITSLPPDTNQNFNSSAEAITNLADAALSFSDFVVTVDNIVRTPYNAIPADTVTLNIANQL